MVWNKLTKAKGFKGKSASPEQVSKFMKSFVKTQQRDNKGKFIKRSGGKE